MNAPNASGWRPEMGSGDSAAPPTASGDRALMLEEPLIFELAAPGGCGVDWDEAEGAVDPALSRWLRATAARCSATPSCWAPLFRRPS